MHGAWLPASAAAGGWREDQDTVWKRVVWDTHVDARGMCVYVTRMQSVQAELSPSPAGCPGTSMKPPAWLQGWWEPPGRELSLRQRGLRGPGPTGREAWGHRSTCASFDQSHPHFLGRRPHCLGLSTLGCPSRAGRNEGLAGTWFLGPRQALAGEGSGTEVTSKNWLEPSGLAEGEGSGSHHTPALCNFYLKKINSVLWAGVTDKCYYNQRRLSAAPEQG